ncbi:transposase, partial [Rhodoblastus acidophilus]
MALRPETLPRDPDRLIEMLLASEGKNEALQATIRTLKEMIFGSRSEKLTVVVPEQMALSLGEAQAAPPEPANDERLNEAGAPAGAQKRRKRNIGALPPHLPRHVVVIEPDSMDCPCCAGKLHRIGEAVSEALDRIAPVVRVVRTIRPKYACRACEEVIVQAKAPARLIEGGMVTTAFVSHIAVAKYGWYSTLYRQMQILAGYGVEVDRQTLSRWLKEAARMLKSLYERQLAAMHLHAHLFCDETRMPVLDPGKGRAKTCQLWAHATDDRPWRGPAPPAVAYVFADGRGKKEIAAQLATFSGTLQVDGYSAYKALLKDERAAGAIQLAFCLTHARRKFVAV